MKVFAYPDKRNVGDTLTPILVSHFLPDAKLKIVTGRVQGKLVAVGSILNNVLPGDIVWGTGAMFPSEKLAGADRVKVLAARGQLTREIIESSGGTCPIETGDPALLLPLIYRPAAEKRFKVGYIPHFVDYAEMGRNFGWRKDRCLIDVFSPLPSFIEQVTVCERIVASSLHGLVIAEAYGIPVRWEVYSDKVRGKGFKFRDYLTGTGREIQKPGEFPPIPDLHAIQQGLLHALGKITLSFDTVQEAEAAVPVPKTI